jgi:hypothetical protein
MTFIDVLAINISQRIESKEITMERDKYNMITHPFEQSPRYDPVIA